jgi:hypothetical protein
LAKEPAIHNSGNRKGALHIGGIFSADRSRGHGAGAL